VPERHLPPKWRHSLRVSRGAMYIALVFAGAFGVMLTPLSISGAIGEPLSQWWAFLLGTGAVGALIGVGLDRYRVEWIALWPAIGGGSIYAITIWSFVASGEGGRATQASVVTAMVLALLFRALELGAHAAKLRADHENKMSEGEPEIA
jgi:hypothetical protein